MDRFIYSLTGWVHFVAAVIALLSGTAILALRKGTGLHVKIGYVYTVSMLVVNLTAFMIYRLFGGFGIFHIAAMISLLTVLAGILPAWLRKPENNWLGLHFGFMYWSVMGLYAAFAAEVLTRIPDTPFLGMVGYATGGIMLLGGVCFYRQQEHWKEQFSSYLHNGS